MNFKPAQCPSCGGALQVPDDRTTVNCMYCGASIVVREAIHTAAVASVPNLLRLAQTALASSNCTEAYEYFTRVLELDGNNIHAWAGKAESAGKLSSHQVFRMPEMLNYFGNAITNANEPHSNHIRANAAKVICSVVSQDYIRMRSALTSANLEEATWAFFVNRLTELLKVLEDANRLIPADTKILQTIIWFCDQNSSGIPCRNHLGKPFQRPFDVRWKAWIKQVRQKYLEELYRVNPQLRPAPITARKSEIFSIDRRTVFVGLGLVLFTALLFMLAFLISVGTADHSKTGRAPLSVSPTPATSTTSARSESGESPKASSFATTAVCSLPAVVFKNSEFARLGGGNWRKWSNEGGELDHACEGGTDLIKLKNDGALDVAAEYSVLGNAESVHYVSAEYTAFRYAGPSETEKTLRRQYADFCDRLAMKVYGTKLSETFRNRLLNESTYSTAGSANSYHEKIGIGYIRLSSNRNDKMVMLDVHLFPTESDFRTYKDS
jgi:hypothetical protein